MNKSRLNDIFVEKIGKQTSMQKKMGIKPPVVKNGYVYKWDFLGGKYRKVGKKPGHISNRIKIKQK